MPHESNSLLLKMGTFYYKESEKERKKERELGRVGEREYVGKRRRVGRLAEEVE